MKKFMLLMVVFLFCLTNLQAQIAIGAKAGTIGPGMEFGYALGEKLNLKVGYFVLPLNFTSDVRSEDNDLDLEVAADLKFGALSAIADFHPTGGVFRLSGGIYYNMIKISSTVTPTSNYNMDGKEFTPDKLGNLAIEYTYPSKINPYLGIGFGNLAGGAPFSVQFDLGALYVGSPEVTMDGEGMIAPTVNWAGRINEALETFKWYPVLSLGFGYHF